MEHTPVVYQQRIATAMQGNWYRRCLLYPRAYQGHAFGASAAGRAQIFLVPAHPASSGMLIPDREQRPFAIYRATRLNQGSRKHG